MHTVGNNNDKIPTFTTLSRRLPYRGCRICFLSSMLTLHLFIKLGRGGDEHGGKMRKSKSPSFCPSLVQPSTIEAGASIPTHLRTPGGDIVTLTPVVLRSGEVSFLKSKTSAQAPKQCAAPCKVNLYGKEGKGCRKVVRLASGTTELFIYRMYQIS